MKVRIDGPCFIESDSPFTVVPIYQSNTAKRMAEEVAPHLAERIPPVPKEVKHAKKAPKNDRRFKRERKTCPVCHRGYLAIPRSLYCSDVCRHRAYEAHGGSKKAREWALRIHAGATGVEVQPDDQ